MHTSLRRLLALTVFSGTLALSACGSSSSSSPATTAAKATATTATKTTTAAPPTTAAAAATTAAPATTKAPPTTAPATTAAPADTTPLQYIDPTTLLKQVPGYEVTPAPESAAQGLVATFNADPNVRAVIQAIGGASLTSQANQAETKVLFLGLKDAATVADSKDFVTGVIGDGTNVRSGDVKGYSGSLYTDTTGAPSFVTVRGNTALLATGPTEDDLTAALDALLAANPDL